MGVEEGTMNGGGGEETSGAVQLVKNEALSNGFGEGTSCEASMGSSEGLRTYKRRRCKSPSSESKIDKGYDSVEGATHLPNQENWRIIVLEHMYQSLSDGEGGLHRCIQDALVFHKETNPTAMGKVVPRKSNDIDVRRCSSPKLKTTNGKAHDLPFSGAPSSESEQYPVTEICQGVFFDILVSEKFTSLCKLFSDSFQGIKPDSVFHLNLINSRMKEGVYEQSPVLFSKDIEQMWTNLQGIGNEIVSLTKSLRDMSRTFCNLQVGCSYPEAVEEEKLECCARDSGSRSKWEYQTSNGNHQNCAHKLGGGNAEGGNSLSCNYCEQSYRVSSADPAVRIFPPRIWYCANCVSQGIGTPHENCTVCERLNTPKALTSISGDEIRSMGGNTLNEFKLNSNCIIDDDGYEQSECPKDVWVCRICGGEVDNSRKFTICEHPYCQYKYYHVTCLTTKQLNSYSPRWYCPSCLCRTCLTDKDDDKIVLCDACDEAYHLYCMTPVQNVVPSGKWFCISCIAAFCRIKQAKSTYENPAVKLKLEEVREQLDKVGVDMLLNAASTLSEEESMAAMITKDKE